MITYEYSCTNCKHEWEEEANISDPSQKICPNCQQETAKRLISNSIGGFRLIGQGWFQSGGY